MYRFSVEKWAFWDGLGILKNHRNVLSGVPQLVGISPIVKRRMPVMAKQIQAINQSLGDSNIPVIYASKNGELSRTINLIRQYGGDLSPASFSMSVHNAIPGLLSVINQDNSAYTVIDSMNGVLEMAVVEATTLFDQYNQVKVVYFEENTTEELKPLKAQEDLPMVLMMLVSKGDEYTLSSKPIGAEKIKNNDSNTKMLDYISVLQAEKNQAEIKYQRNHWTWVRN